MLIQNLSLDCRNLLDVQFENSKKIETRTIENFSPIISLSKSKTGFGMAVALAQIISDLLSAKGQRPTLCLSGGLDSQAMLHSFVHGRIDFDVAIFSFTPGFNKHEVEEARAYCNYYNIVPKIIAVDVLNFFESGEYFDIAIKAQTNSPQFSLHAYCANLIDGAPICAGEAYYLFSAFSKTRFYTPLSKEYAVRVYLESLGRNCISHFFEQSIDLIKTFVDIPSWKRTEINDKYHRYALKAAAYRMVGFPVWDTSHGIKFNGFENLLFYYQKKYASTDYYYFNRLFREPLEKIILPADEYRFRIDLPFKFI